MDGDGDRGWDLPLAWDGDRLLVTDPAALAQVDRTALSASTMASMEGCPARYVGEKLIPGTADPFGPAELGTATHAVLEELFNRPASRRDVDLAMRILLEQAERAWPGTGGSVAVAKASWVAEVRTRMLGLWEVEDPTRVRVRRTEWPIRHVEVAGIPFTGFIDRTDLLEDHTSGVVDYKAGVVPRNLAQWGDKHGDQVRLYVKAVEAIDGEAPTSGRLIYTRHGKVRDVPLSRPRMNDTLRRFERAWTDLKGYVAAGEFTTKVSGLCGYCPLVASCPVAATAGKTAKVAVPSPTDLGIPVFRTAAPPVALEVQGSGIAPASSDAESAPTCPEAPAGEKPVNGDGGVDGALGSGARHLVVVREGDGSAHVADEAEVAGAVPAVVEEESGTMSYPYIEAKSWEGAPAGQVNANSYAAMGAFGLVELAHDLLIDAGQKVTPSSVRALTDTFALVVERAQVSMTGQADYNDGAATRVRGALRSVLKAFPFPFDAPAGELQEWVTRAVRRCESIAKASHVLLTEGPAEQPWLHFAAADAATARRAA